MISISFFQKYFNFVLQMKDAGEGQELVSTRVLKLRQYLGVYNELTHMSLIQSPITASEVLDK